jgi:ferredoxin/nitroreductase
LLILVLNKRIIKLWRKITSEQFEKNGKSIIILNMLKFRIDENKCTRCGLCVQDCPSMIIVMGNIPYIKEGKENHCLKCQHCLSVCPEGALSILGINPDDCLSVSGELPDPEILSRMIKTRRSVRKYKDENIDSEVISRLTEAAACAPSGHNDNKVLLSISDNKDDFSKLKEIFYSAIREAADKGSTNPNLPLLAKFQVLWIKKQIDVLFRGAPHMIIASSPEKCVTPMEDCLIALSYFEISANANGVGTLWNGMVKWVLNEIAPQLKKKLGIPDDHIIGGVIVFGKSDIEYARAVQSEGLHINKIKMV